MKKRLQFFIITLIFVSSCDKGPDEVENFKINNLEPSIIHSVCRVKSVDQLAFYKRVEIEINRSAISAWSNVEKILLVRSTGPQSTINKDSSGYNDFSTYSSGPAWVYLILESDKQKLSAPSDTFHFIVP